MTEKEGYPKNNDIDEEMYQFCPYCEANLTLQKGYREDLPYWVCRGCGKTLLHPAFPDEVVWVCDTCGAILNLQDGFCTDQPQWTCTKCGAVNEISDRELYDTEDEYYADRDNPYKGMSDRDILALMQYEEIGPVSDRSNIALVRDPDSRDIYVKKILQTYDVSVYRFLLEHPIPNMPRLYGVFEGKNHLIILEEYIRGKTLSELLTAGSIPEEKAVSIILEVCGILRQLHQMTPPVIHRDVKPSNIMLAENGSVYLLDINAAKWYKPEQNEDTRLIGTPCFAAPEQFGYGFYASSEKTDIYALGILLNVMLTGKFPKEVKAPGSIWEIIENCIALEPTVRYSDEELIRVLRLRKG